MILIDALVLVPLVGAAVVIALSRVHARLARWVALLFSVATLVCAVTLGAQGAFAGDRLSGTRLLDLGFWRLAVDGLSMPLVALTALLSVAAISASWEVIERPGAHFGLLLLLEAAVMGVFLAEDLILFYVFWELVLIPMYFLIGGWGHERRRHAAAKFFIYTFVGSVLMLAGLLIAIYSARAWTMTSLAAAAAQQPLGALVFWLLMAGFLVKVPAWPFHTWLPDAHVEAPTAGSIMLAGVLLKMGGYGILRVAIPLCFPTFQSARPIIFALGLAGIVIGALTALVQSDLKRLVAYSSVAHMGFVLVAIATATAASIQAAMLVMVSHGFVAGALFLLVGMVYERTHTREMRRLGGLGAVLPKWSTLYVFSALASLGLPGLSGFPGEFVTMLEGFGSFGWWMAIAALGVVLAAAYNLHAVRGSVQGPVGEFESIADLGARETLTAGAFAVCIVLVGLMPNAVVSMGRTIAETLAALAGQVM